MRAAAVAAALLASASGAYAPRAGAQGSGYPGAEWPVTTPAAAGVSQAVLDSLDKEIAAGTYGFIDRMLVIRGGRVVFDKKYRNDYDRIYGDSARSPSALAMHHLTSPYNYFSAWWHPYFQRGDLHTLQSVTKTVTSVVIGAATQRGEFPSLDTPVLSFFDTTKVKNIDDRKRRLTIRHLMNMSGGFEWNENLPYADPRNDGVVMEAAYDWVGFVIDKPMARDPGTMFNYSSGESELLAYIFHKATGVDVEEYAARHLFGPVGITHWYWKRTPNGLADTEGGLYLEARDLARIWLLFLKGGSWNGQRIVSEAWVKASTTPAIRASNRNGAPGYSLKWWLPIDPTDSTKVIWAGSGFGGQLPYAFPGLDLIVVFNGWNILPGQPGIPQRRIQERLIRGTAAVPPRGR